MRFIMVSRKIGTLVPPLGTKRAFFFTVIVKSEGGRMIKMILAVCLMALLVPGAMSGCAKSEQPVAEEPQVSMPQALTDQVSQVSGQSAQAVVDQAQSAATGAMETLEAKAADVTAGMQEAAEGAQSTAEGFMEALQAKAADATAGVQETAAEAQSTAAEAVQDVQTQAAELPGMVPAVPQVPAMETIPAEIPEIPQTIPEAVPAAVEAAAVVVEEPVGGAEAMAPGAVTAVTETTPAVAEAGTVAAAEETTVAEETVPEAIATT